MCGAGGPQLGGRRSPFVGQENCIYGAGGLHLWRRRIHLWGRRTACVGQQDPMCGAGGPHLWGRTPHVGQETPPPPRPGGLTQVLAGGEEAGGLFDVVGQ